MENFKRTKGNWTYSPVSNFSDTLVCFIESDDKAVAQLRGCETGEEEEALSNAKLIAAAPSMYDMLCRVSDIIDKEGKYADVHEMNKEINEVINMVSGVIDNE